MLPALDKLEFKVPKDAAELLQSLEWPEDHNVVLRLLETVRWWSRMGPLCGLTFTHALATDVFKLLELNTDSCRLLYTAPKWDGAKEVCHSDWWPYLTFKPNDLAEMIAKSKPDFGVVLAEERIPECMLFMFDIEWNKDGTRDYAIKAMYTHMLLPSGHRYYGRNFIPLDKAREFGAEWPDSIIWQDKSSNSSDNV